MDVVIADRPKSQKRRSARRMAADASRSKATYDMGKDLADALTDIAQSLGCSRSDVAAHLLAAGVELYVCGRLDLARLRVPHTCRLRFSHKLPPPVLPRREDRP